MSGTSTPAAAAAPPPVDPSVAGAPGADTGASSWAAAAQPATPTSAAQPGAPSASMPKVATTDATTDATIPNQPAPALVLTPKQSPLSRAVDATLNALTGGGTKPQIATDANGNEYVKHVSMTHGEQWFRIAGEAVHGAFAGLAAGKGAGNQFKGGEAGWEAGSKDAEAQAQKAKDMSAEARQQNLDNANYQMLQMQKAEQAWKFTRMQTEASQHDVDFVNGQVDRLVKNEGGTIIGNAAHAADIGDILKVNPDVMADMIKKHQIEIVPHYDAEGKAAGITAIKMPDGYRQQILPAGAVFHTFDATKGEYVEHHASDPMTAGQRDDYESAAAAASLKFQNDKTEADLKAAQAKAATSNADAATTRAGVEKGEEGSVIAKNNAEAAKAYAEARKAKIEGMNEDPNEQGGTGGSTEQNAEMMVDGLSAPSQMSKRSKVYDAMLPAANAYSMKKYGVPFSPEESEARYQARKKVIEGFAQGKEGDQVQSLNQFFGHASSLSQQINQLRNTDSPLLNVPLKNLRKQMGETQYAQVSPLIYAVRKEYQNFLNNNMALHGDDITEGSGMLNDTMSLAQMQAAIKGFGGAALTRAGQLNQRFRRVVQTGDVPDLLDDNTKSAIRGLGLDGVAKQELGSAYTGQPSAPAAPAAANPQALRAQAAQAGIPQSVLNDPRAQVGHDAQGNVIGWQDANGWHQLGAK